MPVTLSSPAVWVDHQELFDQTAAVLEKARRIGVDTESNSLHAYREQVCLIQFSDDQADFLIDPLSGIDLSKLGILFADPSIEKIFHASEYDILCLKRDFGFEFAHLFDTMQAARILGMEKLGLSSLLFDLFAIDQGKSFQKADWGRRPMDDEMRHYARLDTHYLPKLRDTLAERLAQKNLTALAEEDFRRLCQVNPNQHQAPLYAQVSGYHRLEPQTLAVLNSLCRWRDGAAKKLNRPHFKVVGNSALLALSQTQPKNAYELRQVKELPARVADRYEKDLLDAVRTGLVSAPIHPEKRRRPSQAYIDRLEALHDWRKSAGKMMGVPSDIVLPRDILEEIAGSHPRSLDALQPVMTDVPWRFAHFGHDIIKTIEKGTSS